MSNNTLYSSYNYADVSMCTAQLLKEWHSPIDVFYLTRLFISYVNGCHFHGFVCQVSGCNHIIHQFLNKNDTGSMANLCWHAKACRGPDTVSSIEEASSAENVLTLLKQDGCLRNRNLEGYFKTKFKGQVSYSNHQHTTAETRYIPSHWCHLALAHASL